MQKIAVSLCLELVNEPHVLGILIFGSAATGKIHEKSDLDIAVIYDLEPDKMKQGKEEREIQNIRVEVWRYSKNQFAHTFEDETLRDKHDTWMWTSLWIELMRSCKILVDPYEKLQKWKQKASTWRWLQSEIEPVFTQAKDNLKTSKLHLEKKKPFRSLICLREAITCLSAARLMEHGSIPSFRPKDLSTKLYEIKEEEKELFNVFTFVNDVASVNFQKLDELVRSLSLYIDAEWGSKRRGPLSELENARSCMFKHDLAGALLSVRYSAYWLGYHILGKREIKIKPRICNAKNHVEMLNKLEANTEKFYNFYKKLHFFDQWKLGKVKEAYRRIKATLEA